MLTNGQNDSKAIPKSFPFFAVEVDLFFRRTRCGWPCGCFSREYGTARVAAEAGRAAGRPWERAAEAVKIVDFLVETALP